MTAEIIHLDDYREKDVTVVYAALDPISRDAIFKFYGDWEEAAQLIKHLWIICKDRKNANS